MYNKKQNDMSKELFRMQMLAGIITESQYKEMLNENNWDNEIKSILYSYSAGNDNEYKPGYKHKFNQNVELDADDDLIPFYNFLKTEPKKTYTGNYKNVPVIVKANTEYEDEDLGDLIITFTEPYSWD